MKFLVVTNIKAIDNFVLNSRFKIAAGTKTKKQSVLVTLRFQWTVGRDNLPT